VGHLSRFVTYAIKFEQAYASGEWALVGPCFTEGAVYAVLGPPPFAAQHKGRDAVLASFDSATRAFDKQFASREVLVLDGPEERQGHVFMHWAAIYHLPGAPDLRIEGKTKAFFSGDQIQRLEDEIPTEYGAHTLSYLAAHGEKLRVSAKRS